MKKQELIEKIMKLFWTTKRTRLLKTLEKLESDLEDKYKEFNILIDYSKNDNFLDLWSAISYLKCISIKYKTKTYVEWIEHEVSVVALKKLSKHELEVILNNIEKERK